MSRKSIFVALALLTIFCIWRYVESSQPVASAVSESILIMNLEQEDALTVQPTSVKEDIALTKSVVPRSEGSQQDVIANIDNLTLTITEQLTEFVSQAQQTGAIPFSLANNILVQPEIDNYIDALVPVHELDFKLLDEIEQALYQQLTDSQFQAELHRINCGGGFCMVMLLGDNEPQLEEVFKAAIKPQRIRAIFSRYIIKDNTGQLRIILSYSDAISGISVPSRSLE